MSIIKKKTTFNYKPTVLDVFCGAGGMSLGFKNAGCQILGGIDSNQYAIKTHHHNFPLSKLKLPNQDIKELQDLAQLDLKPGEIDIIVGGPPCQGFSIAGIAKMQALGRDLKSDYRNSLYKEFVRFVDHYKPLCFVMENVDNLANKSEIIEQIQNDFSSTGYKVDYKVLNACDFGVPQKRKRVFIIGIRCDLNVEPIFPDINQNDFVSVGEAILDLPDLEPVINRLGAKTNNQKPSDQTRKYRCPPQLKYQEKMRKNKTDEDGVLNHICRSHNDKDIEIFKILKQGGKYKDLPQEMMRYRSDIFADKYRRLILNEPSWTLTAHMSKDGLAYIHPLQNRSISVREAARIQSFPDDFVFCAPMTEMFKLIGNSVPPLLAEAIAKPLVELIKSYR
jgi:DNA (cytosine-5)-methyltransferase 1